MELFGVNSPLHININYSLHSEGAKFVVGLAIATAVFAMFCKTLTVICALLMLFCLFFFRNPKRVVPAAENLVVSPADGTVSYIGLEVPPDELEIGSEERYKVSIFLSIANVHVTRLPFSGTIKKIVYCPGSFINAVHEKSSVFNERNTVVMELRSQGGTVAFTQIAGMLARRIVCDLYEGQEVIKGNACGIIRFGSRCDVWLPAGVTPCIAVGQTMIGGETVIANLKSKTKELLQCTKS